MTINRIPKKNSIRFQKIIQTNAPFNSVPASMVKILGKTKMFRQPCIACSEPTDPLCHLKYIPSGRREMLLQNTKQRPDTSI